MEQKNSIIGLGLDQLTKQIKGQEAFVVDNNPPAPPVEPAGADPKPPVNDGDDKNTKTPDILKEPIQVSDANARNVDDNNNPPAPKGNDDASSPFAPFANVLKEQGVLYDEVLEGVDLNSVEGFVEAIQRTIEHNTNSYKEQFIAERSPEVKNFIEMIEQGIPLEEAQRMTSNQLSIRDFTEDKLSSNKELQKKAITMYLSTLDMSEDEIRDQIEYFEDTDKLYNKAVGFSTKLKQYYEQEEQSKKEQMRAQEENYRKQAEEQVSKLKDTVFKTSEIIPGRPLNDKVKEKLFASITTPAGKDPNTGQPLNKVALKRMEDPISFEIKLHYLHELGVFDDKWDGIISSAKSQAVKDFEKALKTTSTPSGKSPVYQPESGANKAQEVVDSFKQLKEQLQKSNYKI